MRVRVGHISPLYGYTFRSSLSSLSFIMPFTLIFHRHTIPAKFRSPKPMCFTSRRLRCNKSAIRIFYSAIRKNKSRTCEGFSRGRRLLPENWRQEPQSQGRPEPRLRPYTSSLKPLATSMNLQSVRILWSIWVANKILGQVKDIPCFVLTSVDC